MKIWEIRATTRMRNKIEVAAAWTVTIAAVAILLTAYARWIPTHDEKVMEAAAKYERCVWENYGTDPASYRRQNGQLPYCDISNR